MGRSSRTARASGRPARHPRGPEPRQARPVAPGFAVPGGAREGLHQEKKFALARGNDDSGSDDDDDVLSAVLID